MYWRGTLHCAVLCSPRVGFVSLGPAGLCSFLGSLASLAPGPMVMAPNPALNPALDLNLTLGPVDKETAWHHRAG